MSSTSAPSDPESAAERRDRARTGALAATLCYFLWGLVPLYWKLLAAISPLELIAHRHVWSLAFLLLLISGQGGMRDVRLALGSARSVLINLGSAALLTTNWLVYVWGVNTGHVIETSLGYFLVPLVNVAAGRFLLHEHLRRMQWIAIGCAAFGVGLMIVQLGRPPWIALTLAGSWGAYSLMRKLSPLGSLTGLTVETLLLAPVATAFLLWLHYTGVGAFGRVDAAMHALLIGVGVVTAVPLLLFAYGARRIRLTTLGLLQYVAPTVQLILGIWFFHEPFPRARALSFGFIWIALALYTADNLLTQRRELAAA